MFVATTQSYKAILKNTFLEVNDAEGKWIERVLYPKLKNLPTTQLRNFKIEPECYIPETDIVSQKSFLNKLGLSKAIGERTLFHEVKNWLY